MNRLCLAFVVLAALLAPSVFAQTEWESPMSCVAELPLPQYYPLAYQAQITGSVKVAFTVGYDGVPTSPRFENAHPVFEAGVGKLLSESRFEPWCAGRNLEFEYIFRLQGEPTRWPGSRVLFVAPNRFEVTARPPIVLAEPMHD